MSAPVTCSDDRPLFDGSSADPLPASSSSGLAPVSVPPTLKSREPITARRGLAKRLPTLKRKPPKASKIRKLVHITLAMRAQGLDYAEISEATGKSVNTIKTYMHKANREGWISLDSFEDPQDKLDLILRSQAVQNIHAVLGEKVGKADDIDRFADKPSARALDASLEIAKGTGMLKQHQAIKSESASTLGVALKVQVEMPKLGDSPLQIREGSIGGQPAFDAEIVE